MSKLAVYSLQVGMLETNCYFLADTVSRKAICIDPGGDAEKILVYCKTHSLILDRIILTHGHYDHISAVNAIVDLFHTPVWIHPDDVDMATNPDLNLSSLITVPYSIDSYLNYFEETMQILFENHIIDILHTPGHTLGSVCFLNENQLISGDTLFRNSVGRSDFPGSRPDLLIHSIEQNLMPLDDAVIVYPGHGMTTTIGHERERNPFLGKNSRFIR